MGNQKATKINWKKYLFELLVIITGISISFMVQSWREDRRSKKTEKLVLNHVLDDLKADSLAISEELEYMSFYTGGLQKILTYKDFNEIKDSLAIYLRGGLLNYSYLEKEVIGYQSMLQFEVVKTMDNQQLAKDIMHLYSGTYPTLDEWHEIDKTLVLEQYIPYYRTQFPFGSEIEEKLLQNHEIKNIVVMAYSIKGQLVNFYTEALEEIKNLKIEIEKELSEKY